MAGQDVFFPYSFILHFKLLIIFIYLFVHPSTYLFTPPSPYLSIYLGAARPVLFPGRRPPEGSQTGPRMATVWQIYRVSYAARGLQLSN